MSYSESLYKLVLGWFKTRSQQLQKLIIHLETVENIEIATQIKTVRSV